MASSFGRRNGKMTAYCAGAALLLLTAMSACRMPSLSRGFVQPTTDGTAPYWQAQLGGTRPAPLAWSDDGRYLILDTNPLLICARDGRELRYLNAHGNLLGHVAAATATPTSDTSAAVPDAVDGLLACTVAYPVWTIQLFEESPFLRAADFSADGELLATAGQDGRICLWATGTGRLLRRFKANIGTIRNIAIDDSKHLIVGIGNNDLAAWHLDTGAAASELDLARARGDGGISVFDAPQLVSPQRVRGHARRVREVSPAEAPGGVTFLDELTGCTFTAAWLRRTPEERFEAMLSADEQRLAIVREGSITEIIVCQPTRHSTPRSVPMSTPG